MRVIEMSNKVYLVRHWLRWYLVKRGVSDWELLGKPKNRKRTKPFDLDKVAKQLAPKPIGQNGIREEYTKTGQ